MKISKLLVLSAAWLGMSSSAMADVPEGVWTMPEPTGLEFTETMPTAQGQAYLYNPVAKMFFYSGYDWNTRAAVAPKAFDIWFEPSTEADAPEGSFEFWDNFTNPDRGDVSGPHNIFTDDGGASWCDHASQGNYSWAITMVDGFVRIQNVALIADKPDFAGKYLGWNGTDDRRLYMLDPTVGGAAVDWKFVTYASFESFFYSDDYEAYVDGANKYFSGVALEASLKAADELKIDIEEWLAVYTNKESTKEELDEAKTAVDAVVTNKKNLQKIVDRGALVNAPIGEAELILANSSATAEELKAAIDTLTPIVEAREALKKALDEAKQAGFEATAAYDAVYNNQEATTTELKKALEDLSAEVIEWGKTHATVDNPADMTGKIVNPNFDNASYSGWSGTAPNMTGSGSHGPANVAEKWNDTFDTYQDIEGLPAGVYALGAQTMWRGSWNDFQNKIGPAAFLYAKAGDVESKVPFNYAYGPLNTESMAGDTPWGVGAGEQSYTDEEAGVTYYIPNDPSCFRLYAEKGLYDTKVLFAVSEGQAVRIGVKNPSKMGDADNWTCFDTFTLKFYGGGADACQLYVNEAMKNFSEYIIEEGTLYTEAYLTAYQTAYQGEKTASSMAEVDAIIGGINDAKTALDNNIALWKKYQKTIEKGDEMRKISEYVGMEETDFLSDYLDFEYEDIIKDVKLTNEELTAEIEKLEGWMATMEENSKKDVYDGKDMTKYIKNPGFDEDEDINSGAAEGWTINAGTGSNITRGPLGQGNQDLMISALGEGNFCFEAWHRYNWDVWQEVENLPIGMYELQVQGYVRCEMGGYNRGDDLEGEYTSPVYLYMNNAMSQFPSVYSECPADYGKEMVKVEDWYQEEINGNYYPNSMGGAAQCFGWGLYKTTAYGLIAKEGEKFRIGVKMLSDKDWWCIWDSFKLIYRTPSADLVKPILEEELAKIDLSKPMGKNVFAQAENVTKAAQEAIANNDGAAMFAALTAAYDLSAAIISSSALFAELATANEDFFMTLNSDKAVNTAALAEANTLYNTVATGIENHEYEDADVPGLLDQMAVLRTRITLPDGYEAATDDNKAEFTNAIQNPSFYDDEQAINSSTGWKNPGNLGNDDEQKSAEAIEFWQIAFDMSQTIVGLPEGTYIVQADAWCRVGGNDENYEAWKADPAATMAYLYAVDGDSTVYSVPVANMMKAGDILLEATGYQGEAEFTTKVEGEDVTYYLPGSLVSGKGIIELNDGVYTNKVIAKVKADGKLTIGIKKATEKGNSWVVCDDFKLFYCGTGSSLTPSDDASTSIESIAKPVQVKVEYFTLDGRKATRLQKGLMIQKVTFENGATIVKKIRK